MPTSPAKKRKKAAPRPRYAMPAFIRRALAKRGLLAAYRERPPYQRNDYIGWITRAVRASTREQRLEQMLSELERGGVYMKMTWHAEPLRPPTLRAKKKT
jgi:uncharacterized protein YdeI (YjbR/CyaY-like superfamily)